MTLDEAFGQEQGRCQRDRVLSLLPFIQSPNVISLVQTALETIVEKLLNDPDEQLSISELIEGALLTVIVRAYNAGLAAGGDSQTTGEVLSLEVDPD